MNAIEWQTKDDVYDSFFQLVGAPEWHGRNLNAILSTAQRYFDALAHLAEDIWKRRKQ